MKVHDQGVHRFVGWWGLFLVHRQTSPQRTLMMEGRGLLGFFIRGSIPFMRASPSRPSHPRPYFLISRWIRDFSTWILGGGGKYKHLVHNILPVQLWFGAHMSFGTFPFCPCQLSYSLVLPLFISLPHWSPQILWLMISTSFPSVSTVSFSPYPSWISLQLTLIRMQTPRSSKQMVLLQARVMFFLIN